MMIVTVALVWGAACSRDDRQERTPAQGASPPAATAPAPAPPPVPPPDAQGSQDEKLKGYGYGTPSGREAHEGAGQAAKAPARKTPQQEQDAKGTTEETTSGTAAPQGAQEQGSHVQGGTAPSR
jgi:hypothetical protein